MLFEVTFDDTVTTVAALHDLWIALHIDDDPYVPCYFGIVSRLLVFGELDLSAAYNGHTVKVRIV